jgi:hypothetical protein
MNLNNINKQGVYKKILSPSRPRALRSKTILAIRKKLAYLITNLSQCLTTGVLPPPKMVNMHTLLYQLYNFLNSIIIRKIIRQWKYLGSVSLVWHLITYLWPNKTKDKGEGVRPPECCHYFPIPNWEMAHNCVVVLWAASPAMKS